jgi:hypothetical protein
LGRGKITQVDIGIGNKSCQQDNRIYAKAGAVRHPGDKRYYEEPKNEIVHQEYDQGETRESWFIYCLSRLFFEPREPRGGMILQNQSEQRSQNRKSDHTGF